MYLLCRAGTVLLVAALISGCGHGGPTGERSAENASQPAEPAVPVPSFSAAEKVGMFVYPKNNQSKDQQLRDELDCYNQVGLTSWHFLSGPHKATWGFRQDDASQSTLQTQPIGDAAILSTKELICSGRRHSPPLGC